MSEGERIEACEICAQTEMPETCFGAEIHTGEVQNCAWALARYVHGPDATAEQASWFLEDAESAVSVVHGPHFYISAGGGREVALTNVDGFFEINGVTFHLDPNGEMGTVIEPSTLCPVCARCFFDGDDMEIHAEEVHSPAEIGLAKGSDPLQ